MPTRSAGASIPAALGALLALSACKPMNPRPASAPPPQQQDAAQAAGRDPSKDPAPGDSDWKSSSALGKARDAAVHTRDRVNAYQQEVGRQADEVFKNP